MATTDPTINVGGVDRLMTNEEMINYQNVVDDLQAEADAQAAKDATKQSAIEKLAALGLTVDEIKEAFGLEAPQ